MSRRDTAEMMENHVKKRRQSTRSPAVRTLAYLIVGIAVWSPAIVYFLVGFEAAVITALIIIVIGVWR